jgi:nucleoside phosphorylase
VSGPLLVVGALHSETLPLVRALRERIHQDGLWTGILGNRRIALSTCGVGPRRAARATSRALAQGPWEGVLSIGTCGALVDDLAVGQLVRQGADWLGLDAVREVSICTVRRAVWDPGRRAQLAAEGHAVVEMEAAAVAACAAEHGLPSGALKVVSDRAGACALSPGRRPGPVDIARFQLRALRLSQRVLLPALQRLGS